MRKSSKMSEEAKRKISLSLIGNTRAKGHKHILEWKITQSKRFKGKKHPFWGRHHKKESNEKNREKHIGKHSSLMTEFKKGNIPWNKNKKGVMPIVWNKNKKGCFKPETIKKMHDAKVDIPLSEEHKRKISESEKGRPSPMKNRKHKEETIKLLSKIKKISCNTPEWKNMARERRKLQVFPLEDTKIEVKIQDYLKQLRIEFYVHHYIKEIEHGYQCDILIPVQQRIDQRIIIECDGNYWHGNPRKFMVFNNIQKEQIEKDKIRTKELIEKGYKVLRLWEDEIKVMNLNEFRNKLYNINASGSLVTELI